MRPRQGPKPEWLKARAVREPTFLARNLLRALVHLGQMRLLTVWPEKARNPCPGNGWEGDSRRDSWFGTLSLASPFPQDIQPCPAPWLCRAGSWGRRGGPQGRTGRLCLQGGDDGGKRAWGGQPAGSLD